MTPLNAITADCRLALVARPTLDDAARGSIARAFTGASGWETLVERAEAHGLAPLLRAHLRAAGVAVPSSITSQLLGLAAYHRRRAAVQSAALGDVLDAFARVGVEPLVLKGAALARLIYPDVSLRPMGDVDLLVRFGDLDRAWRELIEIGFGKPPSAPSRTAEKHRVATRDDGGVAVSVELHYHLLPPERGQIDPCADWKSLIADAMAVEVAGRSVRALGPVRFLWHLCRHLRGHAGVFTPLRLIWIADIVAFADRFVAEIDWREVRERDPEVIRTLGLLDAVVPLSPAVRAAARLSPASTATDWADFTGWPRKSLAAQRAAGRDAGRIVRETLWPDAWWLRLHHGLAADDSLVGHRLLHHPREIVAWTATYLRERAQSRLSIDDANSSQETVIASIPG